MAAQSYSKVQEMKQTNKEKKKSIESTPVWCGVHAQISHRTDKKKIFNDRHFVVATIDAQQHRSWVSVDGDGLGETENPKHHYLCDYPQG